MNTETYQVIRGHLDEIPIFDTHEHLPPFERDWAPSDVLGDYMIHYASSDLVSAGLSKRTLYEVVLNRESSLAEKWDAIAPYWEFSRTTGYCRALEIAARDLYGVDHIGGDTIGVLNERFMEASRAGGHFEEVLHRRCHIEVSVLDSWTPAADPAFFRRAVNIGGLIRWTSVDDIKALTKPLGEKVDHFVDYLDLVEKYLNEQLDADAVCVKCALAYERSLRFEAVSRTDAKMQFRSMVRREPGAFENSTAFQDFMLHFILSILNQRGGVAQFHTGLQEGCGNALQNSDPLLLNNLFAAYPNVRFDLFHISYPYQGQLAALAKNFQNVYADMCWANIISPSAARAALDDFLDAIPHNKILAFGGDYCLVDGVYGHLLMAKDNVARVLAERVERGDNTLPDALLLCDRLFYQNGKELFRL